MSSNTRCSGLSRREGIQRLVWPARSPDLNPIENVWDALGRQVAGRNYPPTNKNTLIRAFTEEWDKLPQQLLDNVVQNESRFSLSSDCRRQLIWRESGTAYRPENIQEKDRYPTCSIMVWAGIMINGRTRLHVVANGTMMGQRYIDEVLLPHVRLFRGAVGDKFVFMDDNATCHRTLSVQDCLDSEGIQRLVWPARSPDLKPM
ncbi:transposable element Tcb1 transposase [Trichonephila clavipes]|nr:transposable element Tcb1 transposase [Trichonephila clavipes]